MAIKTLRIFPLLLAGIFIFAISTLMLPQTAEAKRIGFLGHAPKKGCTKCHKEQYKSWLKTSHAKAMEDLKPGKKKKEKLKAELDPDKDYTSDKECLECHTTGYGKGGFVLGNTRKMKKFSNIGCEACHGPGKNYQNVKKKYPDDDWARKKVIDAGMKYGEKEMCEKCHNEDSHFKPSLDPKYELDYKKSLEDATHEHFKLKKHKPRKESEWLYKDAK